MAAEDQTAVSPDDRFIGNAVPAADSEAALLRLARRRAVVTALIGLGALCAAASALWQIREHDVLAQRTSHSALVAAATFALVLIGLLLARRQGAKLERERHAVMLELDLERRVAERTRALAALNRELEAFTDSVSHDLRAPLRGLRGYIGRLESAHGLPAEACGLIERIAAQGEHMEQLVEALLELSQISRYDLRRTSTDVTEIAASTLRELASREPQRAVRVEIRPGLNAYADPRLMRVLFENLLGNAWKFTRERRDALIEVGSIGAHPGTLFVRDNGAGFDPDYAERLFQPFQRLHPASRFEGTGIGLATVQRIVRRHGGRIRAESTPGAGATFTIELPMESSVHYTRP
jgi:signal transduction histidine kinase